VLIRCNTSFHVLVQVTIADTGHIFWLIQCITHVPVLVQITSSDTEQTFSANLVQYLIPCSCSGYQSRYRAAFVIIQCNAGTSFPVLFSVNQC
jgi:hypothetical protein